MSEYLGLPLIPTEDLIKEVEKRCETFVCVYELPQEKQVKQVFQTWYGKGQWLRACALVSILNNDVLNSWNGELKTLQRLNEEE